MIARLILIGLFAALLQFEPVQAQRTTPCADNCNGMAFSGGTTSGGGSSPSFNWANFQNNTFTGAATSVNIGSTSQNAACGSIAQFDTLVARLMIEGETTDTITPPAGWTQLGTTQNDGTNLISYWYKIAGASETCSYTFSWVNSHFMAWTLADYHGTNHTTPVDVVSVGTVNTGAGTAITASSISPVSANDVLVTDFSIQANTTITGDPTQTNRISAQQESSTAAVNLSDQTLSASGATGTRTGTGSTFQIYFWMMLALKS